MLEPILAAYGIDAAKSEVLPFGTGLINNTWKVKNADAEYVLQRINQNVFRTPRFIAENIRMIGDYLEKHAPDYLFVRPIPTNTGDDLVHNSEGYFRLMPFIRQSRTYDVAGNTRVAFEAARQFGCFTKKLAGFPVAKLRITLPHFHDLSLRYSQFKESLTAGNTERIQECGEEIAFIEKHRDIVDVYDKIVVDRRFKKRVTHHDTKISNVLFGESDQGLCVIDMDTTMSGYFISDVGDMMRTYLCPLSEEEKDYVKLEVRDEYFEAIASGYLKEMREELTTTELDHFVYAGEFMIYMQAVRFLADYFNNDIYYGSKYEKHNLVRARNQIVLLQRYLDRAAAFRKEVMLLAGSLT